MDDLCDILWHGVAGQFNLEASIEKNNFDHFLEIMFLVLKHNI